MTSVLAKHATAHVVVVGDGDLRSEMERYVGEMGIANRVSFLGWRHDLAQVYTDLDVLVISSNNEGTPVSAIEAMAAGRPVVATRVGGLPSVISRRRDRLSGCARQRRTAGLCRRARAGRS